MFSRQEREQLAELITDAQKARQMAEEVRPLVGVESTFDHAHSGLIREAVTKEDAVTAIRINAVRRLVGLQPIANYHRGWWQDWAVMAFMAVWLLGLPAYGIWVQMSN